MFKRFITQACLCAVSVGAAFISPAVAGPLDDALTAKLLPGWRLADGRHMAALEVTLAPGWKTYWRAPGDAGIPPQFDWRGSGNLKGVQISWPTPEVLDQDGLQVIGYSDKMVLPLMVRPNSAMRDVTLNGEIQMGVCKDVCIPVTVRVDQRLDRTQTKPDARIAAAMADRPYSAQEAKVGQVSCQVTPIEDGLRLTAEVNLPKSGGREVAVIETDNPQVWVAQAKTSRKGKSLTAVTELYHVEGRSFALNRSGVRITVIGSTHAVDIQGCPAG